MVSVKIMDITPNIAREFLKHNDCNRPIRQQRIAQYVKDMESDRWHENGEQFTVCKGKLKSGQHRLLAAIKCNFTIYNAVVVYVDDAEMIDCGKPRSSRDRLQLAGYDNAPRVILSALNLVLNMNYGIGSSGTDMLTEKYKQWQKELEWLNTKFKTGRKGITKAGVLGGILAAKIAGYDEQKLNDFCDVLITGVTLKSTDTTIIVLRDFSMTQTSQGHLAQEELYWKTQAALKAYEKNNVRKTLSAKKNDYYTTNSVMMR